MATIGRPYVSGNYLLNLDGVPVGFVKSALGGGVTADVIAENAGPSYFTKKHLGGIKYEEFTIRIGLSMNKAVYDWISASWQMKYSRKSGAIISADYDFNAQSERQFSNALIAETTIPAMDGSAKEPAYLTLKLQPELVQYKKATGKVGGDIGKTEQKLWLPSNFRLDIAGLDCTRVNKIDAFTVKQTFATDGVGNARDVQSKPGRLNFPNLKVSLSEAGVQTWVDWHDDFVIKGNNGESNEKNGSLAFLSPNRTTELGRINFFNLGIFRLAFDESDAAPDPIKRVTAELYCERMDFQYAPVTG
jgi:hypothetical protein